VKETTMTDRPASHDGEDEQTRQLAPENANSEQDDSPDQAQTVADEALRGNEAGLGDTEKVAGGIDDFDQQDLVDHMEQMVTSGRIDMSAFRGEPDHYDEEGAFGPGGNEEAAIEEDLSEDGA
jgi:hypothetical protein